jgi:glutamyl-tRNA reductase
VRDLLKALAASDIVVTCSTAPAAVLAAHHMQGAAAVSGDGRRRLVIDLGLPRNVDPDVVTVEGVELLDLETISLHAPLRDLTATDDAREIVSTAAAEFRAASAEDEVAPAVVALRTHIFDVLEGELERVRKRGDSSEATEKALRHLVSVLVHQPSVRARELARQGEGARVVDAVQALFGLDVAMPSAVSSPVAVALPRAAEAGSAS